MKVTIGTRIRKIRESKDYSQQNVADELGVTISSYSKIERGITDAPTSKLIKIAEILEVDVIDFFVDIKKKTTKLNDPKKEYGFATKGDIEEIVKIIQDLTREVDLLKTAVKLTSKNSTKKEK